MASSQRRSSATNKKDKPVYHIVSHSHWDREWYKPFEQFRAMLVECVDSVLDLLNSSKSGYEYFMLDGQTCVLEDYLEIRPEREQEIKKFVKNGRLKIGPWYNLPDEFLVSSEAMIRNLLRGKAISEKFGRRMKIGYIPDSFGHAAAMPTIFAGFGIDNVILYRGFGGEPGQETSEYIWNAPDGTRAVMHHLHPDGYSAGYFAQDTPNEALEHFLRLKKMTDERALTEHRLILGGGDHHFPDPNLAKTISFLRKKTGADIRQSSLEDFMKGIAAGNEHFPDLHGELHFGFRYAFAVSSGVYSSRMYIKQKNWHAQRMYERYVEPLSALSGNSQYDALIKQGWKYLLQNHPHDSICGCSVDAVHDEMETRFAKAEEIGEHVIEKSLDQLVPRDDKAFGDDKILCIFNPSATQRNDLVSATIDFYLQDVVVGLNPDVKIAPKLPPVKGLKLMDSNGKAMRFQVVDRKEDYGIVYSNYNYPKQTLVERFNVLVDTGEQDALSIATHSIAKADTEPNFVSKLKIENEAMENDHVRVEVLKNGAVKITDKNTQNVFSELNLFEDGGDAGDEYCYSYPEKDMVIDSKEVKAEITVLEHGPLRGAIQIKTMLGVPVSTTRAGRAHEETSVTITSKISLCENSPLVEFETTVENTARDHRLRALFETGIQTDSSIADEHFALIERKHKEYNAKDFKIEVPAAVQPMQRFVTIQNSSKALTLFSYGLPEYELKLDAQRTLALTLLRSVGKLSGSDLITRLGGDAGWKNDTPGAECIGSHTFRYAVFAHKPDDWETVLETAEAFHTPRLAFTRKHSVKASISTPFEIDNKTIALSALKKSEDGKSIVIRLYNPTTIPIECSLSAGKNMRALYESRLDETRGAKIPFSKGKASTMFLPFEVKTFIAEHR
jgi:alpha-mannosidase